MAIFLKWLYIHTHGASLVAQMVKNLPAMRETWIQALGWEDPLEKGMATHSSILAWRIPWVYSSWGRKELDMTKRLSLFTQTHIIILKPVSYYGSRGISTGSINKAKMSTVYQQHTGCISQCIHSRKKYKHWKKGKFHLQMIW